MRPSVTSYLSREVTLQNHLRTGSSLHRVTFPIDLFAMGHLFHSTKRLFEQHHLCRGTTLHRNHFAQESLCPGTSLHRSYFAQEPLSTGTTLHRNHFAQEPICRGTTLHRNHLARKPVCTGTALHRPIGSSEHSFPCVGSYSSF